MAVSEDGVYSHLTRDSGEEKRLDDHLPPKAFRVNDSRDAAPSIGLPYGHGRGRLGLYFRLFFPLVSRYRPEIMTFIVGLGPAIAVLVYLTTYVRAGLDGAGQSLCGIRDGVLNAPSWDVYGGPISGATSEGMGGTDSDFVRHVLAHSSFYSINLIWGHYSFMAAKAIDLTWDVLVGKGGSMALAWVTYRVSTTALLSMAEDSSVAYELYASLSNATLGFLSLWQLCKELFSHRGHRFIILGLVLGFTWTMSFSTFMSAMTGYYAPTETYYRVQQGSLASFADFNTARYTRGVFQIVDGDRIGLSSNYTVSNVTDPALWQTFQNYSLYTHNNQEEYQRNGGAELEALLHPSAPAPLTINGTTYNLTALKPNLTITGDLFLYSDGELYNGSYNNYACISGSRYAWGFSGWLLIFAVSFHGAWCLLMYAIHSYSVRRSELCRVGRRLGPLRATIDLSEAIEQVLGSDICAYSELELTTALHAREMKVRYRVREAKDKRPAHIGLVAEAGQGGERLRLDDGEVYGRRKA
ncbi:MAG: hypothetical protein M1819_003470 [Sarea resinae]|nr:MAG: hypothetical protein M1819_003470 [Sarea resinae]